jgi:hypothetical protein
LKESIQSRFDWILQVCFCKIRVFWEWALVSSVHWQGQCSLSTDAAPMCKFVPATTVATWSGSAMMCCRW